MQENQVPRETSKFLNGTSTKEEKASLLAWYNSIDHPIEYHDDALNHSVRSVKKKLIKQLAAEHKKPAVLLWPRLVAAAVLILASYFGWRIVENRMYTVQTPTNAQLAAIQPAKERAIIILENGEEIDLDKLAPNDSLQRGDVTIMKDGNGEVTYLNNKTGVPQMNTIRVPKASVYTLTLSDGSRVTLNSESKLTYPTQFSKGNRKVSLEGEGYFEIQKTPNKDRFIVVTDQQEIEVYGTKFNVKSFGDEGKTFTTLAEGSVQVTSTQHKKILPLKPQQQIYTDDKASLSVKTVDLDQVLGWTNGQFVFDGVDNDDTFNEIARWYDIDIRYLKNTRNDQYIGIIPRNLALDKLIALMSYAELQIKPIKAKNNRIRLLIN